ncbi:hypothetical protein B0H14DRAFT_3490628 [Mycena olivaceomarginata]|nr:hypothetical protein B0H14DRAFT_3490628 [Mycena olivaceomarginata]
MAVTEDWVAVAVFQELTEGDQKSSATLMRSGVCGKVESTRGIHWTGFGPGARIINSVPSEKSSGADEMLARLCKQPRVCKESERASKKDTVDEPLFSAGYSGPLARELVSSECFSWPVRYASLSKETPRAGAHLLPSIKGEPLSGRMAQEDAPRMRVSTPLWATDAIKVQGTVPRQHSKASPTAQSLRNMSKGQSSHLKALQVTVLGGGEFAHANPWPWATRSIRVGAGTEAQAVAVHSFAYTRRLREGQAQQQGE